MIAKTKKEFESYFRQEVLPELQKKEREYFRKSSVDIPLRREEWNNLIDALVEDGQLPKRALDWYCPW